MNGGAGRATPTPRKPRRRRLSRRRFWRRVVLGVLLVAALAIATRPALRSLGYLSTTRHSRVTMDWEVVRISPDRRSVLIRVDECGSDYAGTQVTRVGSNVRLMVSMRPDDGGGGDVTCGRFDEMPTHVVNLGFALPPTGSVLASGCPRAECDDDGAT